MTPVEILALITGLLNFPKEVMALIKLLQDTPEEKRDDIRKRVMDEFQKFSDTGRPPL